MKCEKCRARLATMWFAFCKKGNAGTYLLCVIAKQFRNLWLLSLSLFLFLTHARTHSLTHSLSQSLTQLLSTFLPFPPFLSHYLMYSFYLNKYSAVVHHPCLIRFIRCRDIQRASAERVGNSTVLLKTEQPFFLSFSQCFRANKRNT